ncbi:type II toxin-antitoxin system death-on-curing family toxin [Methylobacillus gramineus]|uniref:type II toxin-antitoxin system death-on-curing family toxin n=1 Tax=Methylobacillus gramineus TaxID=755169 RepID=UPI001CFF9A60|nr:type II toxin-antitoxin system death-on-curing family toxin [Methylobacillus gramineus]MCB5185912.1 type II toxin-antitoxin system death-on-curing family toxin [Methylobacillus gramineus]
MAWRWIDKSMLLHDESLAEHGGDSGLRDEGLLDSALARPVNELPDIAALAASYCVGLAKNHPFVDGNKRAALLATGLFLLLNGKRLTATQAEATLAVLNVAAGKISEEAFAEWIRQHSAKR